MRGSVGESGIPDESPAGAFCVGAQKLDALGDVSRSPGSTTPYSSVRRSSERRRDAFRDARLLFSPPEARPPIAGEPVILGSDRPNSGTRHIAGCRLGGHFGSSPCRHSAIFAVEPARSRSGWLMASLRAEHDLRSGPQRLWAERALDPRPQDRRVTLAPDLQVGVDRRLVRRALQLPERGSAGQVERRVETGRFRERGSRPRQSVVPGSAPSARSAAARARRSLAVSGDRGIDLRSRRPDRCSRAPAARRFISRGRERSRCSRGCRLGRRRVPPTGDFGNGARPALADRPSETLPGRVETDERWLGDHHGAASTSRLCQRVAASAARWSVAPARGPARKTCQFAGILDRSRDRIVPSRPYGHKTDCDLQARSASDREVARLDEARPTPTPSAVDDPVDRAADRAGATSAAHQPRSPAPASAPSPASPTIEDPAASGSATRRRRSQDFRENPETRRRYWEERRERYPKLRDTATERRPSRAGAAASAGRLSHVITQNIDGLHQKAGSDPGADDRAAWDGASGALSRLRRIMAGGSDPGATRRSSHFPPASSAAGCSAPPRCSSGRPCPRPRCGARSPPPSRAI